MTDRTAGVVGSETRYLPTFDVEAAGFVAESPDARRLNCANLLLEDRRQRAGDEAPLEVTQRSTHRRHPGASHAFKNLYANFRGRSDRHFDDADFQRRAEFEQFIELCEPERNAEFFSGDVRCPGRTTADDVFECHETQ